ncbi:MAG: hypothetical protein JXQ65_16175 [Candidatus Marinimicrobia bacterium]|nr:hypothetical protein [Candidatus Neomarinimicrobiota bacterium]
MKNNIGLINILLILIVVAFCVNCSKNKIEEPRPEPLVKIGDVTISKDEFIRRAEYTIRPVYAKGDLNIHKKIILNSLIAEKLMALEVNGDSLIHTSEYFKNYLTGRKNQAVRELHYYNLGTRKVKLDPKEVSDIYQKAGRTYQVVFLNLPAKKAAEEFLKYLDENKISFQEGIREIMGQKEVPIQEISFDNNDIADIHDILFNSPIDKNKIYGPIETLAGEAILFQVKTWKDAKVITDQQIKQRYNDIKDKVSRFKAEKIYSEYVSELMRGKKMDFNRETFMRLAALYGKLYDITRENNKELMNKEMWGNERKIQEVDSLKQGFEDLKNAVLFTLEGKEWTVAMFQEELKSHPLVFRKTKITGREFPAQFRFAVADLIRDKYITEDAYRKGYDQLKTVNDYTNMWKDNLLSHYYCEKYLFDKGFQGDFENDYMTAIRDYLNPLVDSLQTKYSENIWIDTDRFNDISLTKIDLFALQNNVPYPVVVPGFPVITDDTKLDYGQKMKD